MVSFTPEEGKDTAAHSILGWVGPGARLNSEVMRQVLRLCEGGSTETRSECVSREYCAMQFRGSIRRAE